MMLEGLTTCQEEAFAVWKGSVTASAWQIHPQLGFLNGD